MGDDLFQKKVKKGLSFLGESPSKKSLNWLVNSRLGAAVSGFFSSLGSAIRNWPFFKYPAVIKVMNLFFFKALMISLAVMLAGVFVFKFVIQRNAKLKEINLFFAQSWEDELEGEVLSQLVTEFQAENPGIFIKMEKHAWPEIRELLDGETPPDIFSVDPYAIYELEKLSFLAPVTEGAESPGTESPGGNVLQLISFINPLYYNIDLLRKAGFDRPPKNQTEFLSYVRSIKETSGQAGAGLALRGDHHTINLHILSWIWASTYNPNSMESFKFNSKEVIGTLAFLNQLKLNLYPSPLDLSQTQLLEAFGEGKIGMIISSSADMPQLKKTGLNFGITTIPSSESYTRKPVFPLNGWYAGINAKRPFIEQARMFASFLQKKSDGLAKAAYAIPGNGQRNREQSREDVYYAKAFDMYEASEAVRELYKLRDVSGLNGIIRREIELMFNGIKTPEQCAAAIQLGIENWYGSPGYMGNN
jgi:ABC-type glycerol-3-phosphate transport system substrate-binding protein